jgi:hypothetical protein
MIRIKFKKMLLGYLVFSFFTSSANATILCSNLIERLQSSGSVVSDRTSDNENLLPSSNQVVENFKKVKISSSEKSEILNLLKEYNIDNAVDIKTVSEVLGAKLSQKPGRAIKKSNEFSEISNKIYSVLEKRLNDFFASHEIVRDENMLYNFNKSDIKEFVIKKYSHLSENLKAEKVLLISSDYNRIKLDLMKAKFNFSEQVAKIESFKLSEYQTVTEHPMMSEGYTLVSLKEYPAFAMTLAKNKKPPKKYGEGGVLSAQEYRDIISTNLWLFTLEGHDLKHIHFGNAHPMAAASLFRLTRSKNPLRYTLVAGMYEGVDTIQYSWESSLARHFSNKGFTLEQAMLHLATAPQSELMEIAKNIGLDDTTYGFRELKNWKPSRIVSDKFPKNAVAPEYYEADIVNFLKKSINDLRNPRKNIYMKPDLIPDGIQLPEGTSNKPGEDIHYRY